MYQILRYASVHLYSVIAIILHLQDTLLYRHTNEAESVIADSIVWDWSASRGGQSSYPNTEDVMEENTDCDLMECTEATDTTVRCTVVC